MSLREAMHISGRISGILFAEDFDDPIAETLTPRIPDPIIEPASIESTFTRLDLETARKEAFGAGQQAARDSILDQQQADIARLLGQIESKLDHASLSLKTSIEDTIGSLTKLILAALAATLPSMASRHAANDVGAIVHDLLLAMTPETAICITVAPAMVDAVRTALAHMPPSTARRVAIASDDAIDVGDTHIAWNHGLATRSTRQTHEAITRILSQLGLLDSASPTPQSPQRNPPSRLAPEPEQMENLNG